jgi:hypothetical protein
MTIDRYQVSDGDRSEAKTVLIPKGAAAPPDLAQRRAKARRGLVNWVLFTGLFVALYQLLSKDNPQVWRRLVPSARTLAGCAVYAAGLLSAVASGMLFRRFTLAEAARKAPQKVAFTAAGLEVTRGAVRRLTYWSAFHSFAESENLFVLRERPDSGTIIPKRQFADAAAVEATRVLLANKLAAPAQPVTPAEPATPAPPSPRAAGSGRDTTGVSAPATARAEFTRTIEDFVEVMTPTPALRPAWRRLFRRRGSRFAGPITVFGLFLGGILLMLACGLYLAQKVNVLWLLSLATPALGLYAFVQAWEGGPRRRAIKLFEAEPRVAGPWTVEARADGLRVFTPTWESAIGWEGITGFTETPNLFLVYDAERGYPIPKRGFADAAGAESFRQAIRTNAPGAPL